jgi:PAS domain S-box-containing protein
VVEAADGVSALRLAGEIQPSLAVVGIRLPDMSGFEVCKRLKSDPMTYTIPVLHISAVGRFETDIPEALDHQSDAYLREPVEPETLVAIAQALIRAGERQRQSRNSEAKYRKLLESALEGVWVVDAHGRIEFVNQRMAEMLKYSSAQELLGRNGFEFFDEEDRESLKALLAERMASDVRGRHEGRMLCADGSEIWASMSGSNLQDEQGRTTGRMVLFTDITEQRRAQDALAESQMRLQQSEAKFRAVFRGLAEGVVFLNMRGEVEEANNAVLGGSVRDIRELADVLRGPLSRFIRPDGTLIPVDELPGIVALRIGEAVRDMEMGLPAADGTISWRLVNGQPVYGESGNQIGAVVSFFDISDRKRAEEAARESRATLESALASITDAVSISDAEGRLIHFNDGFATFHRFRNKGDCAKTFAEYSEIFDTYLPDGTAVPVEMWAVPRALRGETVSYTEYSLRRKDTGETWAGSFSFGPIRDKNGAIVGCVVVGRDITERKRSEERLRQAQKLESIGLLAGGIAHDFNNLLTGILGNASLVLDEIGPRQATRIDEIVRSAERAADLTRQLLAYSGKGQFVVRDLDVSQAVNAIVDLVQFSIPKSVEMTIKVQRRLPAVRMDPGQLQQILMNLLINAGEAIGEGHPGRITIATSLMDVEQPFLDRIGAEVQPGRYVCIEVADTGAGIDEEKKAKIFDPFFTTKFTGRGLGLAAVAGILRSHKGAILLDSVPGRGCTFRVLLPAAREAAHERAEGAGASGSATILVVDDEATVRDFIGAALGRRGYRVLPASDGREALGICEREKGNIAAAIVDIVMPIMGANELLPALKKRHPRMKILLTSGYNEAEARRLCAAYPGATFIQKPYTAEQIESAVSGLIAARK